MPNPKRLKLPDLDREMKGKLNKIPPPEFSLFPLHSLVTMVGRRNSGKTYASIQLLLAMKREGAINRIFIISPTYSQNHFLTLLEADPSDVYEDAEDAFAHLTDIENKVGEAAELWQRELEYAVRLHVIFLVALRVLTPCVPADHLWALEEEQDSHDGRRAAAAGGRGVPPAGGGAEAAQVRAADRRLLALPDLLARHPEPHGR
jgi:hypothetical protein